MGLITAAIILARLDSKRFPGKALSKLGNKAVIEHVWHRLQNCAVFDHIILATTGRECDEPLAQYFTQLGGKVYRAAEDEFTNVAKRFVSAARSVDAEYALRANGDSPFLDRGLIEQGMEQLSDTPDLVTNLLPRSYPYGVSVELVRTDSLAASLPGLDDFEREHVTACFYRHPDRFKITPLPLCPWPECRMRLTVDEPDDLQRLQRLIEHLPYPLDLADMPAVIAASNALSN